jgi:nitrate/nitrite transporter NarK
MKFAFWRINQVDDRQFISSERSSSRSGRQTWKDWQRLFRFRTTWGMIFGFFGTIYVLWLYNAWLPGYLEMERHFSISKTGWIAALPYVFGIAGSVLGGQVCDVLVERGLSPINSRKYPMAACLIGIALFTVLAAETPNDVVSVISISISMFLIYVCTSAAWAMAPVAAPANCTASIGAIMNFGGYLGGALAPTVTGFIVQATSSFVPALLVGAAVAFCAAVAYLIMVRGPIPPTEIVLDRTVHAH